MTRRYHRWIATLLGIFILWTAGTGVITQITRINTAAERQAAVPGAASPTRAASTPAPAPPQSPNRKFLKFVTDLHSGEQFGLAGQIVSLITGLALLFLAASGLYMYIQMWRGRMVRVEAGKRVRGGQWFWR